MIVIKYQQYLRSNTQIDLSNFWTATSYSRDPYAWFEVFGIGADYCCTLLSSPNAVMKKNIWKRVKMDTLVWSQESCFNWRLGGAAVVVMNRFAKLTGFISASCKYRDVFDIFLPY